MKASWLPLLFLVSACTPQATAIQGSKGGVLDLPDRPSPQDVQSATPKSAENAGGDGSNSSDDDGEETYYDYDYSEEDDYSEEYEGELFWCYDESDAIPYSYVCDGEEDCDDGSDEYNCD